MLSLRSLRLGLAAAAALVVALPSPAPAAPSAAILAQLRQKVAAKLDESVPLTDFAEEKTEEGRARILVTPLKGDEGGRVALEVEAALNAAGVAQAFSRDSLKAQFSEEEFTQLGFVDSATQVKVKLPGVHMLMQGEVRDIGDPSKERLEVQLRLLSVEDGNRPFIETVVVEREVVKSSYLLGVGIVALVVLFVVFDSLNRKVKSTALAPDGKSLATANERLESVQRKLEQVADKVGGDAKGVADDLATLREELRNAPAGGARIGTRGKKGVDEDDVKKVAGAEASIENEADELVGMANMLVEKADDGADALEADLKVVRRRIESIRDHLGKRKSVLDAARA